MYVVLNVCDKMKMKIKNSEQTRLSLLEAGLLLFTENGYSATRIEDIAKEAGLTRGAFYWHFKNKQDIFTAIFKEAIYKVHTVLESAKDPSKSAIKNIERMLIVLFEQVMHDNEAQKYAYIFNAIEYTPKVKKIIIQIRKDMGNLIINSFKEVVDAGVESGVFKEKYANEVILKSVLTVMTGIGEHLLDDVCTASQEEIKQIVEIFICGIKK